MIRNHSFLATIDELVEWSKEQDVTRVGLIGDMHSGKTTMAKAVGHAFHVKMKEKFQIPFAIRIFYQEDLANFADTLKNLKPANYVLIFDDVTFLEGSMNKSAISSIKQAVTKIRHIEGGQNVKIVLIYNYHYQLGFDKYLRMADFRYFLSVGSSEIDNMEKIVKQKNMAKVHQFIKLRRKAIISKYWSIKVSATESFPYKWRNPFIPVLYYNSDSLRLIVSPEREFMEKHCTVCATAEGVRYAEIPVSEFVKEGETKHGDRTFESAIKMKLFENGMAVHSKSIMNAKRWLDMALSKKLITLDQIMLHYGYSLTKNRLRKDFSSLFGDDAALKKVDTTKPHNRIRQSMT